MKKSAPALLSLAVVCCLYPSGVVNANHAWGKYHWDLSTEQTLLDPLDLGDNTSTAAWGASLDLASVDWNFSVLQNEVSLGASNANCDPTSGRVEICNGEYGNNGWLGIASIWALRGRENHITQAVVKLNDTYFNTPTYDSAAWRQFVMCQEVGHTFGLDHQDENFDNANLGTCMDYTSDPDGTLTGDLSNLQPNQHDFDQLTSIYAHLNSTDGGGGGSGGGKGGGNGGGRGKPADVAPAGAADFGVAVSLDAAGRGNIYVQELPGNRVVITHVLWAN